MKYIILFFAIIIFSNNVFAQPGSARERQENEYKRLSEATKRAYTVPERKYEPVKSTPAPKSYYTVSSSIPTPSSSSNNSMSLSTPDSDWGDGGAYMRRQAAYAQKVKERDDAFNAKMAKFNELSKDVPKTAENYNKLVDLAVTAGLNYSVAASINNALAPKYYTPPYLSSVQQAKQDNFVSLGNKCLWSKNYVCAISNYENALQISKIPNVTYEIAGAYFENNDYKKSLDAYLAYFDFPSDARFSLNIYAKNIGVCALNTDNLDLAAKYVKIAYDHEKYYFNAYTLSYIYYLQGNFDEAAKVIDELNTIDTSNEVKLLQIYYKISAKNSPAELENIYQQAKSLYPSAAVTGNKSKDFANLFYVATKELEKGHRGEYSVYFLQIGNTIDPTNNEILQALINYNKKYKLTEKAALHQASFNRNLNN